MVSGIVGYVQHMLTGKEIAKKCLLVHASNQIPLSWEKKKYGKNAGLKWWFILRCLAS